MRKDMDVTILESDGSNFKSCSCKSLGYNQLVKELDVRLVNLTQEKTRSIKPERSSYFKSFKLPVVFDKIDFFISVPKLKAMIQYDITCALKNQIGCNRVR